MNKMVELFHAIYDTEFIWNFLIFCVGLLILVYFLEFINDETMRKYSPETMNLSEYSTCHLGRFEFLINNNIL